MSKTKLTMQMPKVGDRVKKIFTPMTMVPICEYVLCSGTVVYVNNKKGWYEVKFDDTDLKECYHLPDFDHSILLGINNGRVPVVCDDTGMVYSSLSECARDMGIERSGIDRVIYGRQESHVGHHFSTVI